MEVLRYIKNDFKYVPMIDRIENLEMQVNMLQNQLCVVQCRTQPTMERENDLDDALIDLSTLLLNLGANSGFVNNVKYKLKEAIKWKY